MKWAILALVLVLATGAFYMVTIAPKKQAARDAQERAIRAAQADAQGRARTGDFFSGIGNFVGSLIPGGSGIGASIGRGVGDLLGNLGVRL